MINLISELTLPRDGFLVRFKRGVKKGGNLFTMYVAHLKIIANSSGGYSARTLAQKEHGIPTSKSLVYVVLFLIGLIRN